MHSIYKIKLANKHFLWYLIFYQADPPVDAETPPPPFTHTDPKSEDPKSPDTQDFMIVLTSHQGMVMSFIL